MSDKLPDIDKTIDMNFNEEISRVKIKNGCITIKYPDVNDTYDIPLDRADNPIKILWWVHHLCEKCWFDNEVSQSFIEISMKAIGYNSYQGEG